LHLSGQKSQFEKDSVRVGMKVLIASEEAETIWNRDCQTPNWGQMVAIFSASEKDDPVGGSSPAEPRRHFFGANCPVFYCIWAQSSRRVFLNA
jgi:hypothetical protein